MDFSLSTWWWVAAGIVVAAELATGTFYLLMFALGLAGAAVTAHLGLSLPLQIATAALISGGATALWHSRRVKERAKNKPFAQNPDVILDVGSSVFVQAWLPDHTTRVQYRGTQWSGRLQSGFEERSGPHTIEAVEGNWLVLAPKAQ